MSADHRQTLWRLLMAAGGVEDEHARMRLAATGLPSALQCTITGVELAREDGSWAVDLYRADGASHKEGPARAQALLALTAEARQRGEILVLRSDGEGPAPPPGLADLGAASWVVAPVKTLEHHFGSLLAGHPSPQGPSREQVFLLSSLAEQLAVGLENLRLRREVERRSAALQRQSELILESAGEGIYGLDTDGLTTFINPAALEMLRVPAQDIVGKPMHALLHHTRSDGSPYPREECPIYAAFKDGKVHSVDHEVFWRGDGTSFPVEYTSTPIQEQGELLGAVVVFRNLTDLKRSEENLRRALAEVEDLKNRLQAENVYLQEEVEHAYGEIVGRSPALERVLNQVEAVAKTNASVLILGESGVGKELIARAIHEQSPRSDRPLVKVNCASIPKELFESEFFGHVKGAFTGALRNREGRFQLADGGSLFLDEVGEIPIDLQGKLLRVLQEQEFERVGDDKTRRVDVRLIAATNRDLMAEAEAGRFRQDLYYRLSVFPVRVPPLRERTDDIVALAKHFLRRAAVELKVPALELEPAQANALVAYEWPGNVRELQNVIERAIILSGRGPLQLELALPRGAGAAPTAAAPPSDTADRLYTAAQFRELERNNIVAALNRADWKVAGQRGAAALLGMKPSTLASQIRSLGIKRPQ